MTYDEWLELLKRLEKISYEEDIKKLTNEPKNENINKLLVPKIRDMIIEKFNRNINRIIHELEIIFSDENELDLALVTFKKNLKVIFTLINNNQFTEEEKEHVRKEIIDGTENAYKVLYEAAFDASEDGAFNSIINKNRIKWSD